MVHATPSDFPFSFVLEGEFSLRLESGGTLRAHRVTLASHDPLDSKEGVRDLICFLDTTTDDVAQAVEALAAHWRPFLEPARAHPGRPARLVLEAPPWMLARFNSAVAHPYPPDASDLLENVPWMNAALDVEAYGPAALSIVTERDAVEFELPLDQKE